MEIITKIAFEKTIHKAINVCKFPHPFSLMPFASHHTLFWCWFTSHSHISYAHFQEINQHSLTVSFTDFDHFHFQTKVSQWDLRHINNIKITIYSFFLSHHILHSASGKWNYDCIPLSFWQVEMILLAACVFIHFIWLSLSSVFRVWLKSNHRKKFLFINSPPRKTLTESERMNMCMKRWKIDRM